MDNRPANTVTEQHLLNTKRTPIAVMRDGNKPTKYQRHALLD